jgi:lysophospholipase L1-like esterase
MVPWLYSNFTVAQFQPYIDGIYQVAAANGAAVFDLNTHIAQQSAGDMLADGLHPTDLGSWSIAMEFQRFLTGADKTTLPAQPTYDWSLALKNLRAALGMVAVRPVDVVMLGDSITEGYYASSDGARYCDLLRRKLQAIYNPQGVQGGEGFIPMLHVVGGFFAAAAPTGFANLPQRWTFANPGIALPIGADNGYGLGRRAWFYCNGSTSTATITVFCDRFWICYTAFTPGGGAGSITVKIDGTLQASQPSTQSSIVQSGRIWDSGNIPLGFHTIQVSAVSTGLAIFDGIMVFNGDGGDISFTDGQTFTNTRLVSYKAFFQPRDVGKTITSPGNSPIPAGTTITAFTSVNEVQLSQNTLNSTSGNSFTIGGRGCGVRMWEAGHAGYTSYAFAGPAEGANGYWADGLDNIDPDLVLIQIGPNDSNVTGGYVQPSAFQQNLVSIVNLIRLKSLGNPSIVFVSNWVSGATTLQAWQPFRDAMFNVATNMGCAVMDLSMRMGPGPASGNTDLYSDVLHLTDEGALVSANEHLWGLGISDQRSIIDPYVSVSKWGTD